MIPALAFVGKQNSGKTTLLVQVIAELVSRGVHVGTIKHHSHSGFEFDIEGKDSWRHRQAGSSYSVVAAPDQIACVRRLSEELSVEQIIAEMSWVSEIAAQGGTSLDSDFDDAPSSDSPGEQGAPPLDLILVEGYRHSSLPTIELFRAANPKDQERNLGGEGNAIVAVVTDQSRIVEQATTAGLPTFAFEDITALATFILSRSSITAH
ncbi:MAG: molybdopterin-guanine dinucleotide biosynthesis protein B [Coriobacteriales bacterium]|jgi:molybdopterin-guanine dinucleotide biosynthesis protein|nr:molybdopterin-guanine dinucleotide biosynthesis protein B [Coriobacteriales bacterium]